MQSSSWKLIFGIDQGASIAELLRHTPYVELVEIEPDTGRCQTIDRMGGQTYPRADESARETDVIVAQQMIHPDEREAYLSFMDLHDMKLRLSSSEVPGLLSHEFRWMTATGEYQWTRLVLADGSVIGMSEERVYLYVYDIQTQKNWEAGLVKHGDNSQMTGRRDTLTGLYPERDFLRIAQEMMAQKDDQWCMVDIDIEHYKLFTDWYGQAKAHEMLVGFGRVLRRIEEETGGVAGYLGQDSFCVMLPYDRVLIDRLHEDLQQVIRDAGQSVGFSPIFGICLLDATTDRISDVYNHAALATDQIRGNLSTRIGVYDAAESRKRSDEYRMLVEFQDALRNHEIIFYIQPQCRVGSGKIVGAESLARWRKQDGTWVSPALFVPVLEKYGIVTNLDEYIWEEVCKFQRKQLDAGIQPVPISVNVSRIDVHLIDVPAYFQKLAEKYHLPPDLIKVEITESAYAQDASRVKDTVRRFQEMGFLIMMDDFGTGYSSLNMLRSINVDVIKLDAQFLNMTENEERKGISILESIVDMTKMLATPIIVEGVENVEQVDFLADLGCRYMQGYHFYRPMPPTKFEALLRDERFVDRHGIQFLANQQIHVREMIDGNIYSDVILNNILGPVAFYNWSNTSVSITRYNQQFNQLMGLDLEGASERSLPILDSVVSQDQKQLFDLMQKAMEDRMNGAKGILRFRHANGVIQWVSMQFYFLSEDENGRKFYVSHADVSDLQFINTELPGAYYRCTTADGFEFLHLSENFQRMVGYTEQEIRLEFDNQLLKMVHPEDRDELTRMASVNAGEEHATPYRLRCKNGQYVYVADQSRLTDAFGKVCRQGVMVDVTKVMHLRNQMKLMVQYSSSTIVLLKEEAEGPCFRLIVHGIEKTVGMTKEAFERALNDGSICTMVDITDQSTGWEHIHRFLLLGQLTDRSTATAAMTALRAYYRRHQEPYEYHCRFHAPNGKTVTLTIRADRVTGGEENIRFILVFYTNR